MSRFDLLHSIKSELERTVRAGDLVSALFEDHPELESFEVDVTSEYDDNNYSDYSRLTNVNGWSVDYEGNFEDFDDQESDLPKPSQDAINDALNIVEYVREEWHYGNHTFKRCDFKGGRSVKEVLDSPNLACILSVIKNEKLPVEVLDKMDSRWIVMYAETHGRLSEEDEFKVFAKENMMWAAKEYAHRVGPLSDRTLNYFVLALKADDPGYEHLQEYLNWAKGRAA